MVARAAALIIATAIAASAAATAPTPALVSSQPWWERVTMTVTGEGEASACTFESSLSRAKESCEATKSDAAGIKSGGDGVLTRITFERRFTPGGAAPKIDPLHAGDTFLGGQVMMLAIDEKGAVKGCQVVATSGDSPSYGCREAQAERFQASARSQSDARHAFMTIMVYGHSEELV